MPESVSAEPVRPPLWQRVTAAVLDDRRRPDQRRFRLAVVTLLLVAAVVGPSPSSTAGTVCYIAMLLLACGGWLAWTLLPDAEVPAQAGLALAAIVGAGLMVPVQGATATAAAFAAICLSTAVSWLPPRRAALICAGVTTVLAAAAPVVGSRAALIGLIAVCVGVGVGLVQREHRRRTEQTELLLVESQRTREEQARTAVLAERVRLARDVHDVLAHTLAGLAIQLEAAEALLADAGDRERALGVVRRARGLVVEGIDETRHAVSALRGDAPAIEEGLAVLVEACGRQGDDVSLDITGDPRRIPTEAQLALVRIAREALTNARRHAPGSPVALRLVIGAEAVLTVRNPVPSGLAADGGGYGLTGMAERAALVGGRVTAGRDSGYFTVRAAVPA